MAEMFVNYEKSKLDFISAGLPNVYNNHIVFINSDKCIYTHGKYFADFGDVNFVKGIYTNGDYYNSLKGGGYISFISTNPNKLNINASSSGVEIGLNEEFINTIGTVSAVDSDITIDDIEDTYVKYSPQFLSEELKAQARYNIGITSEGYADLSNYVKKEDLSDYYTKSEIDVLLGDINTILESIINE